MAKKLFTLFTLLALFFGVGRAETVTVTKTMSQLVAENGITTYSGSDFSEATIEEYYNLFLADNIRVNVRWGEIIFWETSPIEMRAFCMENHDGILDITVAPTCTLQSVTFTYSDASTAMLVLNDNVVPNGTPCAVSGNSVSISVKSTSAEPDLHNSSGDDIYYVGITSISVTYEIRDGVGGDWHHQENPMSNRDFIIMNSEKTKVAGSYENGHFTALPCEGNVEFCDSDAWGMATINVIGDDVKIFTLEPVAIGNNTFHYLKDRDGNYYHPDVNGNIVNSKEPVRVEFSSFAYPYNTAYEEDRSKICYNTDESYFGSYTGIAANYSGISGIRSYAQPYSATLKEGGQLGLRFAKISDELQVVKVITRAYDWQTSVENGAKGAALLVCKDDGPAWDAVTIPNDAEDYMTAHAGFSGDWDQSNWVLLYVESWDLSDLDKVKAFEGHRLAANSITLIRKRLSDGTTGNEKSEYRVNLWDLKKAEGSQPTTYTPNLYCPANFSYFSTNGITTGHDAAGNPTETQYFFMPPKAYEFCDITYAVWGTVEQYGETVGYFTLPAYDGTNNPENIYGAARADWSFNNDPVVDPVTRDTNDWPAGLVEGAMYSFNAIHNIYIEWGKEGYYIHHYICPIEFDPVEQIVTGIKDVVDVTDKTVAGVKYYNLAGIESDRPFDGVNIIVTTYTDGSRSSAKVLK